MGRWKRLDRQKPSFEFWFLSDYLEKRYDMLWDCLEAFAGGLWRSKQRFEHPSEANGDWN